MSISICLRDSIHQSKGISVHQRTGMVSSPSPYTTSSVSHPAEADLGREEHSRRSLRRSPRRPLDICHLGSTLTLVRTHHRDVLDHIFDDHLTIISTLRASSHQLCHRLLLDQVERHRHLGWIPKSMGRDIELRTSSCLSRMSL